MNGHLQNFEAPVQSYPQVQRSNLKLIRCAARLRWAFERLLAVFIKFLTSFMSSLML